MFRRYKPFFRAGAMNCFAYKFQIASWLLITLLEVACLAFLWIGVYKNSTTDVINGFTVKEMLVYMVFINVFGFNVFTANSMETIADEIQTGTISASFTKPVNYRLRLMASTLGLTFAQSVILCLPVLAISYAVFFALGYIVVSSVWTFLANLALFFLSELIAVLLYDGIDYICGLFCFYTTAAWGVSQLKHVIISFLSGGLIPLSFFPSSLSKLVEYSPFSGIAQNPVLILMGRMNYADALAKIGIALGWWMVIEVLAKLFFTVASKKITVQGG